jgi:flagellar motor switch protein FliG
MARLEEIENDLLIELDEIVSRCLDEMGTQSAVVEGTRQVAEIINRLSGDKRQMVELLRAQDAILVSKIETSMYDFFMLGNQTEAVLTRIIEEVPLEQWASALKGAEPSVRTAILRSMPRRQAQSFEDLLRRAGPMPLSRVEQARQDIMVQVKALADAGEIEIQLFAEATVE